MFRRGNTGKEITDSGEFAKTGRKEYTHGESGMKIAYNHNRFLWQTPDGLGFTVLYAAVSRLRQMADKREAA